jgi:uncharacterized protein YhaN
MRLLRLHMKSVGPFTDAELDLSAGHHGLHLIYGPNEAGKASVLRALSYLLFGFPPQTPDNFTHPYGQLRVGAELRHSDGEILEVLRRKGTKNTLREPDDATAIAPGRLERFLGGLDQDSFAALFGIDHARLSSAGEEIRTGKGRLGELLFAAGTGLAGLGQAKQRLQERLDSLFKPRGQNQRINQALTELREAQDVLKRSQLPSDQWQQHDRAFRSAQEQDARLSEQIHAARRDLNRLTRVRNAILQVARRRRLQEELGRLGDVVRLRDSFGDECRETQDALHLALRTIDQARATIDDLNARLAVLDPPRMLLDAAREIEALQQRLGAVEKADQDRVRLENFRLDDEHQARKILRELGRSTELDEAEALRLRVDEPTIIRALGQRHANLRGQADEARRTIARHEDQIARRQRELADLEPPRNVEALRRAFRQARKAGDLDARLAEARADLARAERKASLALSRLPGWRGLAENLQHLAVPLDATLGQFESAFQEAERDRRTLDDRRTAEDESIRQLEAQVQALELQHNVPTEDDLHDARCRREEGWHLVRAAWLDGAAEDGLSVAFLAEFAPGRTLAEAYEQSVQRADGLADRLRREADRVGRKSEWLAQLDRHRAACEDLDRDRRQLDECQARLDAEWDALIGPLEVRARTPTELRAWLRRRDEVVQLIEKVQEAHQAVKPLEQIRDTHRAALSCALDDLGGPPLPSDRGLVEWLEQAEAVCEHIDESIQRRAKLESKLADTRSELANTRLSLQTAEDELDVWRADWSAKMARIGIEAEASPEQAEVVLTKIQDLFETLRKLHELRNRLRGIDRDADQFAADVGDLCRRVAPDLEGQPPTSKARELARRLQEALAVEQQQATLAQQRDREASRLDEAEAERATAAVQLERLCQEAGCVSPDQLPEAERCSRDRTRLEDDLRACEDQILALSAGAVVAEFAAEVERADADGLGSAIAQLEVDLGTMETELHSVKETIGAERSELDRMDGGDRAAEAAERAQTISARLQADVALYAKLKLAASVLNRGIERYRDKSQGPVLARASQLSADLTDGSFVRLQIDDDGDGRAVLKGVRAANDRLVGVEGLSDGSHDQLYLALRLASLESWLQAHEPIPFVVDDILLNFDDRRALAALRALAELSQRTQVLFFTHHSHIVDLARTNLSRDVVFIQQMPAPRADRA